MTERENCKCSCSKEPTDTVNVNRFIDTIDRALSTNNLEKAANILDFWREEAKLKEDINGLLSIENEALGLYRRMGNFDLAMSSINAVKKLLADINDESISIGTIYVNLATTMKAFGKAEEAMNFYEKAESIYNEKGADEYLNAALFNNKASALCELKRFEEAKAYYNSAINILKNNNDHDGEIAVSLVNLAHLYFDNNEGTEKIEKSLDEAWDYINSSYLPHDQNYAFILSKCAPSFRFFKRETEAKVLEEISDEIYNESK